MLATAARHEAPDNTKFAPSPVPSPYVSPRGAVANQSKDNDQSQRRPSRNLLESHDQSQRRPSLSAPPEPSQSLEEAKREHHDWAFRMWSRMDRDNNGHITRKELDCEEFRGVLRLVLAPVTSSSNPGGGGATYARAETNQEQALHFCLRKADINNDGWLSFAEFKALMWVLRREETAEDTTKLIFALFDLDTDQHISEGEFREIYRFYLGHHPTSEEFWHEWHNLAREGQSLVSRDQYATWLQTSANQIFCQHAPAPFSSRDPIAAQTSKSTMSSRQSRGILIDDRGWPLARKKDINARSKWAKNFNTKMNANDILPMGERSYFTKAQSLPQLGQFYNTHEGFATQLNKLNAPSPKKELRVLSTDTQPVFNKARHRPYGTMKEHIHGAPCGDVALWEDSWQTPLRYKTRFHVGDRPLPPHSVLEASFSNMGPMAKMLNAKYG